MQLWRVDMFNYSKNRNKADGLNLKTGDGMRTLAIVLNSTAFVLSIAAIIISVKSIRDKEIDKDGEETQEIAAHGLGKREEKMSMDLKALREDRELSQQALADLSGIPRRTIQDIERRGDCRVSTAIKLAGFFGITLDELCKGELKK